MEPNLQDMVNRLLAAGLTQKGIADRIHCSQPTISDIALGKIGKKRPSWGLVTALSDLLAEISVDANTTQQANEPSEAI